MATASVTVADGTATVSGVASSITTIGAPDAHADDLTARAAYDDEAAGFRVLVADTGSGLAGLFIKNSASSADWSDEFRYTGPTGDTGATGATGPAGAAGANGANGADGESFVWQGAWALATDYVQGEGVKHNGQSYICTADHTSASGTEPNVGADWATVWDLMAAAGDMLGSNNLSEITNASTARINLGFGLSGSLIALLAALGTAGQVLTVNDTADNVEWADTASPGVTAVASVAALKALSPSTYSVLDLTADAIGGRFKSYLTSSLDAATQTAAAADSAEAIYITSGSYTWIREHDPQAIDFGWWNPPADGSSDDTTAIEAAVTLLNVHPSNGVTLVIPPENYRVLSGCSVDIARDNFYIMAYGAEVGLTSNPLFTFGSGSAQYEGGGLFGIKVNGVSADGTSRIYKVQGVAGMVVKDLRLDRVAGIAVLGHDVTYRAQGHFLEGVRGNVLDIDGAIAIHCAYGGGLTCEDVRVSGMESGGSVPAIPSDRTTLNAQANTIAVKFGDDSWDTVTMSDCQFGHFQIGLSLKAGSGIALINHKYSDTFFDYCGTHALEIDPTGGGAINFVTFSATWFVSLDDHAVTVEGTGGGVRNIRFDTCEGRQAGKRNWSFTCSTMAGIELDNCRGMGANRLSSNTGSDQDDLVILAGGVTVMGGRFGEDGQPYTGITGNQARYGVTTAANMSNTGIQGVQAAGATAPYQIAANTTAQTNVAVRNNRGYAAGRPNYAGQGNVSLPTSAATQTWYGPYDRDLFIYPDSGTITAVSHNGVQISDGSGPCSMRLAPADTWVITYTGTPVINFVNCP